VIYSQGNYEWKDCVKSEYEIRGKLVGKWLSSIDDAKITVVHTLTALNLQKIGGKNILSYEN
jgi:hypothetical protein